MRLKNIHGFAPAWLLLILAVFGVLAMGYYVVQSNNDNSDSVSIQDASEELDDEPTDNSEQQNIEPEADEIQTTGTVIAGGDSDFGTMLFDGEGQAIYIWELEESSTAECYDDCADAWPPVLTDGLPQAMDGVSSELLGTTERTDGTIQVTYNDHPLYYYAHEDPGEVKCHNISTHGGLWWVIQPDGDRAA